MARGRLISKSLGSSRKFHALLATAGKLGEFCQALYPLLVAHSDDFGRIEGDAFTVKHLVFPTSPRAEGDFDRALVAMHEAGLIVRYVVNGAIFIQVKQFDEHQPGLNKRTKSKFPDIPEDSGNSEEVTAIPSEQNRTEQNGTEGEQEPKAHRAALTREADALFERFWDAYPKKKAKVEARQVWDKLRPNVALVDHMLAALEVQRQTEDWRKERGQFIPYPAKWLARRRWLDVAEVDLGAEVSETARHNAAVMQEFTRLMGGGTDDPH